MRTRPPTAAWLALALGPAVSAAEAAPPRVIMIGVDAADVEIVTPLLQAGKLPTLQRLAAAGTMTGLISHPPTRSPAVWTSIAVGARKETHGIYDYVTNSYFWPEPLRTKEKKLATSDMRKAPALWSVLTAADRSSVVVGWLSTWPAEEIKGAVVAPYIDVGNTRQTTIKGSIYKTGAPRQTFDPALFEELRPLLEEPGAYGPAQRKRFYDEPPDGAPIYQQVRVLKRYNYTASWTEARMHNVTEAALYLQRKLNPDLVMVYYQCPDTFGHRFWHFRLDQAALARRLQLLGADPALAPDLKRRYGDAIDNCYQAVDAAVARLLEGVGPSTSVMVMSDHGFGGYQLDKVNKSVPFDGGHRDLGLLLLSGPAFAPGAALKDPRVEDLAPTALKVLGVPVPATMEGRVLAEALR